MLMIVLFSGLHVKYILKFVVQNLPNEPKYSVLLFFKSLLIEPLKIENKLVFQFLKTTSWSDNFFSNNLSFCPKHKLY